MFKLPLAIKRIWAAERLIELFSLLVDLGNIDAHVTERRHHWQSYCTSMYEKKKSFVIAKFCIVRSQMNFAEVNRFSYYWIFSLRPQRPLRPQLSSRLAKVDFCFGCRAMSWSWGGAERRLHCAVCVPFTSLASSLELQSFCLSRRTWLPQWFNDATTPDP